METETEKRLSPHAKKERIPRQTLSNLYILKGADGVRALTSTRKRYDNAKGKRKHTHYDHGAPRGSHRRDSGIRNEKIEGIRLDFPRIMEVKVLLDVQRDRKISQVILFCSDHITIDASTEGTDMYACIDETITKIMRRMRKHKTRLMKNFRPHHQETIRKLDETVYDDSVLDYPGDSPEDPEPLLIHRESYNLKKLYKEEAIMELELSDKPFVLYRNARRDVLQIVYRRPDGDYSIIELGSSL